MRVVVCTKETPDTAARIEVGPDGKATWGDAPLVINPWDEFAVEEAILLKDRGASSVTVLAMGTEDTREAIKHAVAMGCDEAVLVSDEAFAGGDTLVTSKALAAAVEKLDDTRLVIFGKMTTDGASGQTSVQVGRRLGWSTLTYVSRIVDIDFEAGTITAERLLEAGKETVEASLPAVVSVSKEINDPRYPSFMGIRKAAKAEVTVWGADELGVEGAAGKRVHWADLSSPPSREGDAEIIEGESPADIAAKLLDKLQEEKVL